ncbi:MAG: TonB-dependent receptor [Bacteroidota bacterium]
MKLFTTLLLLTLALHVRSQDLSSIKIDELITGSLEEVLERLADEHQLTFEYQPNLLKDIQIAERPHNRPLDNFLKSVLKKYKLKFYQKPDGTLHVIGQYERVETQRYTQARAYQGPPKRRNISVSGKVIDKLSGETLPFVNVYIPGTTIGTSSNVDGYFTLLNVPTDTQTIAMSYIGYNTQQIYLSPEVQLDQLLAEMTPSSALLEEVVISAEREELMQASREVSLLKMTPAKLASLPSLGEKDVFRAFQLMPGISAANEHTSGLYVRGGTPDQALTLYDGFTVYNVDHLFGFFSAFNANSIKDIQLYKGAFDAKYGGRLSSVIEITGKEGNNRNFNIGGDISLLSLNAFVEVPLSERWTTIAAVRRSWKSPIYNEIFDRFSGEDEGSNPIADRFGSSVSSYFYDLNFKTTWKPSDKDVISLSFYNGKDDLDNSIRPELPSFIEDQNFSINITDVTQWGNTGSSLKWSRRWSDRFYSNTLVSFSNYFSDRDRSVDGSFTDADGEEQDISRGTFEDSNLLDYSAKTDFEWKVSSNSQLEFGAFYTFNDIAYEYAQNDTSSIIDRRTKGATLGGYVQNKLRLMGDRLHFTPGIRYNYFEETGGTYWEPRFNFSFKMTEKWKLKGSAGRYYQFAKRVIREDVLQGSRDFWVLADDDRLPVSSNDQFVLGTSFETRDWLFDVEAYHKKLSGLSEYSLRFSPSFGEIDYNEFFFDGTGVARGIDFLLQKKYGRWSGWLGYTIGDVRNNFEVYGEDDFYAANDVTHEIKLVGMYKWRNWDFAATWIYASGRPYTAPDGGYQLDLLNGNTNDYLSVSSKNSLRLPAYHRFDVAATVHFQGNNTSSMSFSIFNLYNRENTWYKNFEIVDGEVLSTDVKYLGFTPNITYSIKLK